MILLLAGARKKKLADLHFLAHSQNSLMWILQWRRRPATVQSAKKFFAGEGKPQTPMVPLRLKVLLCLTVLRTIGTFHYSMERGEREKKARDCESSPTFRAGSAVGCSMCVRWNVFHVLLVAKSPPEGADP